MGQYKVQITTRMAEELKSIGQVSEVGDMTEFKLPNGIYRALKFFADRCLKGEAQSVTVRWVRDYA